MRNILVITFVFQLLSSCSLALDQTSIDDEIKTMLVSTNLETRLEAARRLAAQIEKPTVEQVEEIAGILATEQEDTMRCAAADIFGAVAGQKQYRSHAAIQQPELSAMITALQHAAIYEQWPRVKICIMKAAGEFDSTEIEVVFESGKKDLDFEVRNAAFAAAGARELRLQAKRNRVQ